MYSYWDFKLVYVNTHVWTSACDYVIAQVYADSYTSNNVGIIVLDFQ